MGIRSNIAQKGVKKKKTSAGKKKYAHYELRGICEDYVRENFEKLERPRIVAKGYREFVSLFTDVLFQIMDDLKFPNKLLRCEIITEGESQIANHHYWPIGEKGSHEIGTQRNKGWEVRMKFFLKNYEYDEFCSAIKMIPGVNPGDGGVSDTRYEWMEGKSYFWYKIYIFEQDLVSIRGERVAREVGII